MASETIRPSTCRRASLLLAVILAAGLSLGKGERAVAATVGLTTRGVLTINGAPAFPIGLSDPPEIGALAPGGQNGLDVVASAGVRVFRVVPPDRSWGAWDNTVLSDVQYAHQWDVAAARRSALTMVWLARLAQATPGTVYDQTLRQVVTSLAPDAGLGFWKGSDEPFHTRPQRLEPCLRIPDNPRPGSGASDVSDRGAAGNGRSTGALQRRHRRAWS